MSKLSELQKLEKFMPKLTANTWCADKLLSNLGTPNLGSSFVIKIETFYDLVLLLFFVRSLQSDVRPLLAEVAFNPHHPVSAVQADVINVEVDFDGDWVF